MDTQTLVQEIDKLMAELDDQVRIAKPATERAVLKKIRLLLDRTREQHTGASRELWATYLPYAARLCDQLAKLEEGWEEDLEFFASENAQFWLDIASVFLDSGEISGVQPALDKLFEAARLMKRDRITQVDLLLQGLDIALEISDKKRAIQLYEEAEKLHRKYLTGGDQYTGSAWLPKIKKMGQILERYHERLRRYYRHAETVIVSIEADTQHDLERVMDYLQQSLPGKIKITRRAKEVEAQEKPRNYRARIKITLE